MTDNTTGSTSAPFLTLGADDPNPVEMANAKGSSSLVITCEHAGCAIPKQLGKLGLDDRHLKRHIAWDIGIEALGRTLMQTLDAPVIFQRYSRLVIDCNRPLWAEDSIPEISDGTQIPGNVRLAEEERAARARHIHAPFQNVVSGLLDRRQAVGQKTALIALHSFTPSLESRPLSRPWHLGILFNRDATLSQHIHSIMEEDAPHLTFTYNQPYEVEDDGDYTIPVHGEQRGLPHTLLEIRNDQIIDKTGLQLWTELLTKVLGKLVERL
ncbi:MAG: N-formylglutamate amidohydrolase [Geminicoccales bacterium]